jgi:GNAT superfamily N-acetyltransferase
MRSPLSGGLIRRYRRSDHDAVVALHNVALTQVGAHLGSGPWDEDLEAIQDAYLASGGEFLVALVADDLVAMGALRRSTPDRAEIKRLRVAPHMQRRGLGREILSRLERRAVQLGYTRLHLDTTTKQAAARSLFARHGYHETGRRRAGPFEVILMEKALSESTADTE